MSKKNKTDVDIFKINIAGLDYRIRQLEDHDHQDLAMGRADSKRAILGIIRDMPPQVKDQCLIHEVIHALSDQLAIGLKEGQVQALSSGLFSVHIGGAPYVQRPHADCHGKQEGKNV